MATFASSDSKQMAIQKINNRTRDWLTLIFLSIIWGSSFILIKKGLIAFDFIQLGALRIGISFIAFLPFLLVRIKKIDWSLLPWFIVISITGSGLPSFLFALAETEINSSAAGLLNSLAPLFTVILGYIFFKTNINLLKILGLAIGFGGAAILMTGGESAGLGSKPGYAFFIVFATICYALNANVVKTKFQNTDSIELAAVTFLFIGVPALIYIILFSDIVSVTTSHESGWFSLGCISLLALVGTVFSVIYFYKLIQRTSAVFASSVAYTIPIVALLWGVLDDEVIGWIHLIGLLAILVGVFLIRRSDKSAKD